MITALPRCFHLQGAAAGQPVQSAPLFLPAAAIFALVPRAAMPAVNLALLF